MKKYFSINENDNVHVGTVIAETNEELKNKVEIACSEHFDIDIKLNKINIDDYINGKNGYVNIIDDTGNIISIFITETWVY